MYHRMIRSWCMARQSILTHPSTIHTTRRAITLLGSRFRSALALQWAHSGAAGGDGDAAGATTTSISTTTTISIATQILIATWAIEEMPLGVTAHNIGTELQQTGSAVVHAETHWPIARPALAGKLAGRAAIWPALVQAAVVSAIVLRAAH